jgi:hypothetical protein
VRRYGEVLHCSARPVLPAGSGRHCRGQP